jgi:hypothetical protein
VKLPHRRQKPILSHAKGNSAQIRGVGKSVIRHPTSLMVLVASPGPSSGGVHDELGIDVHRDRPKPSILGAMDCQHFTMKQKRKRKKPVARVEQGRSPGVAARNVKLARATVYGWRKEDREFDAAWVDAVETASDCGRPLAAVRGSA